MDIDPPIPLGFRLMQKPGDTRITYAPGIRARLIHDRFLSQVKRAHLLTFSDPGYEIALHIKKQHRFFFSTDLKSAFDQVTVARLESAFAWRDIPLGWLTPREYFFHFNGQGGLIQGAPSSPYLFETYCRFGGLDWALSEYCDKLGFHYSRYVDDILISSSRPLGKRIGPTIRKLVSKFGFGLNDKKTKRVDVRQQPLLVLGYRIRGTRIDSGVKIMQALYDPDLSDQSRLGLFGWQRHVRRLNRKVRCT